MANSKVKKIIRQTVAMIVVISLLLVGSLAPGGTEAQAASKNEGYVTISSLFQDSTGSYIRGKTIAKKGNYYFKYKEVSVNVVKYGHTYTDSVLVYYVSKHKGYGYKRIGSGYAGYHSDYCTNGKYVYYANGKSLYRLTLSSMKSKKLKNIPLFNKYGTLSVTYVYNNIVVLNRCSEDMPQDTLIYNTKTKKYKKISKTAIVCIAGKGRYFTAAYGYNTDMDRFPAYVYKCTSTGIKRVKKLAEKCTNAGSACLCMTKSKIYYVSYNSDFSTLYINVCKTNGSGKRTIKKVSTGSSYGCTGKAITSKYCEYSASGYKYRYTYSTGKTSYLGRGIY